MGKNAEPTPCKTKRGSSDRLYAGTIPACQIDPLLDKSSKGSRSFGSVDRNPGYGRIAVADSEKRLQSTLVTLDECRVGLLDCANPEAAHFLALAMLEIRIKLNRVSDLELKALCDAIIGDESQETAQETPLHRRRWRPVLKVVK